MQSFWACLWALRAMLAKVWSGLTRRYQPAQGLVEYGLVLVLIAIFAVGAISVTGKRMSTTYHEIDCGLRNARMGSPNCN
jgi:Flp pilus assembly pilin Flp